MTYDVVVLTRLDEDGKEYLYDLQGLFLYDGDIEIKKETSVLPTTKRGKASRETGTNTDISSINNIAQEGTEDNTEQKKTWLYYGLKMPYSITIVESVRKSL